MPEQDEFIDRTHEDAGLAAALRALPLPPPARSAWPELSARLAARRRSARTRWIGVGLAAGVTLALGLAFALRGTDAITPAPGVAHTDTTPTPADEALIARNRQLEEALRRADARALPLDGGAALASAEIEDLIGMVDLELSYVSNRDDARALWRQRLDLMQQLADVRQRGSAAYSTQPNAYGMQPAAYVIN